MSNLQVLDQRELLGKNFTVYGDFENPLFLAKDVAEWIDYSKSSEGYYNTTKMLATVEDDEKLTITNGNSGGRQTFLTEDGLYEVLMQSRKPIAKTFKREVKIILKAIRQTGQYHATTVEETNYNSTQRLGEVVELAKLTVRIMKDAKDKPDKIKRVVGETLAMFGIVLPGDFYTMTQVIEQHEVLPKSCDTITTFLEDFGNVSGIASVDVFNAYISYCNGQGIKPTNQIDFSRQVTKIVGSTTKTVRVNKHSQRVFA